MSRSREFPEEWRKNEEKNTTRRRILICTSDESKKEQIRSEGRSASGFLGSAAQGKIRLRERNEYKRGNDQRSKGALWFRTV